MNKFHHTEGLSDEQIATYRERMENPRPGGNAGLPETIDVPTFLATLDAKRQRVAKRLDAIVAEALRVDEATESGVGAALSFNTQIGAFINELRGPGQEAL